MHDDRTGNCSIQDLVPCPFGAQSEDPTVQHVDHCCLQLAWAALNTLNSFHASFGLRPSLEHHTRSAQRPTTISTRRQPVGELQPPTMDSEAYMLVTTASHHQNYEDYVDVKSGKGYDLNVALQAALRRQYPELALTVTLTSNGISVPFRLPLPISIRSSS